MTLFLFQRRQDTCWSQNQNTLPISQEYTRNTLGRGLIRQGLMFKVPKKWLDKNSPLQKLRPSRRPRSKTPTMKMRATPKKQDLQLCPSTLARSRVALKAPYGESEFPRATARGQHG